MKKIFLALIIFMSLSTTAQIDRSKRPEPAPATEIQIPDYKLFILKNGLRVIVVQNNKLPRISLNLLVDYDPIVEGEKVGTADLTGSLMRNGTQSKPREQLNEEIDFLGANISTNASGGFGSGLSRYTEEIFELMSDVIINPAMTQVDFDRLKMNTLSGIKSAEDNPNSMRQNALRKALYGDNHPYGEIETEASIEKITLDDCKNFHKTYFRPNISILAVVGDIKPNQAKKLAKKYFGEWQAADVPQSEMPTTPELKGNLVSIVNRNSAVQSAIYVGNTIDLKPGHPDLVKVRLANQILGGTEGRLFLNLREDKGYTYGSYSRYSSDKYVGSFGATAEVRNEVTLEAIQEMIKEMNLIRTEKVKEEELDLAKRYISGVFGLSLENPQTLSRFALDIERYNLPKDYYRNYLKALNNVTLEDVQQAANTYFNYGNQHIIVVGKAFDIADRLQTLGKVQYLDAYGDSTEAPIVKLPEGLTAEQVVRDFIKAVGGEDAFTSLKDLTQIFETKIQGLDRNTEFVMIKKFGKANKIYIEMKMDGMGIIQKQVYDGISGRSESMMGGGGPMSDEQIEAIKLQAMPLQELAYFTEGYQMKLVSLSKINNQPAYVVEITDPNGKVTQEYYLVESKLKAREEYVMDTPQGKTISFSNYLNYKKIENLQLPTEIEQGQQGQAIKLLLKEVKINSIISDKQFK